MWDLVMDGTITADSDISVSPPGHKKKEGGVDALTLPEKFFWDRTHFVKTVYIPGSTVRGALRNAAARAVAAARAAGQRPMTPKDFLLVAKGGVKDRKKAGEDERTVDHEAMARLRREEPIVSLFGAMAEKIAGRWQIGDAVPDEPLTAPSHKGRGARSHPFQREPDLAGFMDATAYKDFLESDRKVVEANLAEGEAEDLGAKIRREKRRPAPDPEKIEGWTEEKERLEDKTKALREEAGGAVNIQQPLGGWQAIPEGARMRHRMRIRNADADELAWAFFALRRLARDGRLGAHESRGEGYFSAEYGLRLAEDDGDFEDAGTLRIADFALHVESGAPVIRTAFERSAGVLDGVADETA